MSHHLLRRWMIDHTHLESSLLEGAGFDAHVAERIAAVGGGEAAYIAALDCTPSEVDRLIAGVAVPETWLFRYPRAYDLLAESLERRLGSGAASLRMLSIGCAAGQEAYCMAMTAVHAGWPGERVCVDAIDRNADVLRVAAKGEYPSTSIRSEIPGWAAPFLLRTAETIHMDPSIRGIVRFAQADAAEPEVLRSFGSFDVIFCRNVLIYLNPAARARLLDSISAALTPGGLFFTGHAEQMIRTDGLLRPVPAPHAFALQKAESHPSHVQPARVAPAIGARSAAAARSQSALAAPTPPPLTPDRKPEQTLDDARDLADAGRAEDAETIIRSIIARRPDSADALELLGLVRMAQRDSSGAKRCFEQAVYLEPARATSLLQLAIMSERSGDAQRASSLWDRARRAASSAGPGVRT